MELYFDYTNYPSCCIAGIIYNFSLTKTGNKKGFETLKKRTDINVVYAMDVPDSVAIKLLLENGFNIIDTNFNNNSGNMVFTLKYVYEKR